MRALGTPIPLLPRPSRPCVLECGSSRQHSVGSCSCHSPDAVQRRLCCRLFKPLCCLSCWCDWCLAYAGNMSVAYATCQPLCSGWLASGFFAHSYFSLSCTSSSSSNCATASARTPGADCCCQPFVGIDYGPSVCVCSGSASAQCERRPTIIIYCDFRLHTQPRGKGEGQLVAAPCGGGEGGGERQPSRRW